MRDRPAVDPPIADIADQPPPLSIERLRAVANRFFIATSMGLVVACTVVALVGHQNVLLTFALTSCEAAIAIGAIVVFRTRLVARMLVTLSFDLQIVTLIFATSNLDAAFAEEAHTIYAVLNLYLLAYACWRSLLLYNGFIIVHHIAVTYVMPNVLWADAAPWEGMYHTAIHSLLALALLSTFAFTAQQLRRAIESGEDALIRAKKARIEACCNAVRAENESHKAENRARIVRDTAGSIDGQLRTLFDNIRDAAFDVGQSANAMATISQTCSDNTSGVKRLFEQTSSNIHGVAKSADTLARSVDDIAERAAATAGWARDAVAKSAEAIRLVEALSASGRRVGDMTRSIRGVADSINLLALNATIEAAHVGDTGIDFNIVARNVKDLAAQTSRATEEIAAIVGKIQSDTRVAVLAIDAIGDTINSAHDHASEIAAATARQKVMTASIARTAATIASETAEVRSQLVASLDLLVSANAMSGDLLGAANGLQRTAEISTQDCDLLLGRLRAA